MRTSPVSPLGASAGSRKEMLEGGRYQQGHGSGIFPRCPAAVWDYGKAPTTTTANDTPRSGVGMQIVSTITYSARALHPLRSRC